MLIVTRKRDAAQVRVICEALEGTVAKVVWTDAPAFASAYKIPADGDYRIVESGRFWLDHQRRRRLKCGHYVPSTDRSVTRCITCRDTITGKFPVCPTEGRRRHVWGPTQDGVRTCTLCGLQHNGNYGYASQWRVDSNSEWKRVYRRVKRQA